MTFGMRLVKSSHNFCMAYRIVNSVVNSSYVKVRRLYEIRMCGFEWALVENCSYRTS